MSTMEARVLPITITPHPNADKLDVGHAFGYQFIVPKGKFHDGDLGVYIMDQSILPDAIVDEMGIREYLSGGAKNRVRPVRLRGVLSEGLFYRPAAWPAHWVAGMDVADELGITKYAPPLPAEMVAKVTLGPRSGIWRHYDIENVKRYPDTIAAGEPVSFTEKLHGTFCAVGIVGGERVVTSKGFLARGMVLIPDERNLYWHAVTQADVHARIEAFMARWEIAEALLFGEVFGTGVQDLGYGIAKGHAHFRAFDLCVSLPRDTDVLADAYTFLSVDTFAEAMAEMGIPTVPEVYRGPFSWETLDAHTSGRSTLAEHLREGVVIKPIVPRNDPELGRVILKSISPDYLVRKGGTEYQ